MKGLTWLANFFKDQYPGILTTLVAALLITSWKKIVFFFSHIPQVFYKRGMEKIVSESTSRMNKAIGIDIFPKVKLKIVTAELPAQELEDKLIIFVRKENKPSVYASIVHQALDKGFLRDSKRYIDPSLYESAKYLTGKISITGDKIAEPLDNFKRDAMRYFDRKMENALSDANTLSLMQKEELLATQGFFRAVLLQELNAVGTRMSGRLPSDACKQESLKFIDFLHDLARKDEYNQERGVLPPTDFVGQYFKVGVLFIRRADSVGLTGHFRAVRMKIDQQGVLSIYVMGKGRHTKQISGDFVGWLKHIAKEDYGNDWSVEKVIEYKLPKAQEQADEVISICCLFRHRSWL